MCVFVTLSRLNYLSDRVEISHTRSQGYRKVYRLKKHFSTMRIKSRAIPVNTINK